MADEINIDIPVKVTGLAQVKSELKALKSELINATDPAEIERLSMAAGKLSDQISDANEKIKVFASGSSFESIGNGLGLIGGQLSSLDFEGAAESAKMLTSTIKGMDPKEIMNGFKGFISVIGQLSNSFVQMGIKLLANPLFLLVAVVAAVVVAIVLLKDKIKLVEMAFDLLMIPIKAVIQALKDLTDWLGLTSFAEEEAAQKSITATNKRIAANEKLTNSIDKEYSRQISLQKANGKDTTDLEIELNKKKNAISVQNVDNLNKSIAALNKAREGQKKEEREESKKQLDELRAKRDEEVEISKDTANNIKVIKATANTELREKNQKAYEDQLAKQKAVNEKSIAEEKAKYNALANLQQKYNDEIKGLFAKTEEEQNKLAKEKEQRELDAIGLSKQKKAEAQRLLDEKYSIINDQLVQSRFDKLKEITLANEAEMAKLKDDNKQAELKRQEEAELAEIDKITKDETAKKEAKKSVEEKYKILKREADAAEFVEDQTKRLEKINNDAIAFEERFLILDEQQKRLNANELLNKEQRDAAQLELDKKRTETEQEFEIKKNEAIANAKENFTNIISGLEATGLAKTKAGQALSKTIALTQIGIDSAVAISKASTLANAEGVAAQLAFPMVPGAGTIARVVSYASTVLSVGANIAKAKALLSSGGGSVSPSGGGGGGGAPTGGGGGTPAVPSFQLFGKNNEANTAREGQTVQAPQQQNMTVTAIVSETEITSTQHRVARMNAAGEL